MMSRNHLAKILLLSSVLLTSQGCLSMFQKDPHEPFAESMGETGRVDDSELSQQAKAELEFTFAKTLADKGEVGPAIKMYERARQRDPRLTARVARRIGVLYDHHGNRSKALSEFHKALEKSPEDPSLLNDIGYLYYNMGKWSEAEQHFRQVLLLDENHKRAWMNLGMALGQQEMYEESLEAFSQVTTKAEAHSNLAFILTTQGKMEQAKTEYLSALSLEPGLQIARAALAKLESAKQKPTEAMPIKQVGTPLPPPEESLETP